MLFWRFKGSLFWPKFSKFQGLQPLVFARFSVTTYAKHCKNQEANDTNGFGNHALGGHRDGFSNPLVSWVS